MAVEPRALHACGACAQDIQMRIVANVQHLGGGHTGQRGSFVENTGVGLGHAKFLSAHGGMKVLPQAHAVHISIAIGQRHHWVARGQERQGFQGVLVQIHLLPSLKEKLEGRNRQVGVLP